MSTFAIIMSLPAASTLQPGSDVRHLLVMAEALVEDFDKILARIGIKILASVLAKFKPDKPDFSYASWQDY